tara:strand:- start:6530 stop:7207 length:678 start_codon:yes stop_codon:yes gene_type:complete
VQNKKIVIFSGGLDSAVLLHDTVREVGAENTTAITFDYDQKHSVELKYASAMAGRLGVAHEVVSLKSLSHLFGSSALVDKDKAVPTGLASSQSLAQTIVPNRNMIMLALTAGWAINNGIREICYGGIDGERIAYPDSSREFADAMAQALRLCHTEEIILSAPYSDKSKSDVIIIGACIGVRFEDTWSCYNGGRHHCGECPTCLDRKSAFSLAGVPDPTKYEKCLH